VPVVSAAVTPCTATLDTPPTSAACTVTVAGDVASNARRGEVICTTGGAVSRTVTPNTAAPTLPCASLAEQFTSVLPIGAIEPDGGTQTTGTAPSTMSSAAGGVHHACAPAGPVASSV